VGCEARKTPAVGVVFFLDFSFYRTSPLYYLSIMEDPEFVVLRRFRDLQDADLAKSALESAGFECSLRDEFTIGHGI
jgi:hypothetical protein